MFFDPQCKPVTVIPLAQVFLDAADLIEQRGWCQGMAQQKPGGPICTIRALFLSAPSFVGSRPFENAVADRMRAQIGTRYIHVWNDMPERTKTEVVAVLRKTAAELVTI